MKLGLHNKGVYSLLAFADSLFSWSSLMINYNTAPTKSIVLYSSATIQVEAYNVSSMLLFQFLKFIWMKNGKTGHDI